MEAREIFKGVKSFTRENLLSIMDEYYKSGSVCGSLSCHKCIFCDLENKFPQYISQCHFLYYRLRKNIKQEDSLNTNLRGLYSFIMDDLKKLTLSPKDNDILIDL